MQEYPKWVYPNGIKESYEPGEGPVLVQDADEEALLFPSDGSEATAKRRGRPPKGE